MDDTNISEGNCLKFSSQIRSIFPQIQILETSNLRHRSILSAVENLTAILYLATEKTPIPILTLHYLPDQVKRTILFCFLVGRIQDLISETERLIFHIFEERLNKLALYR